MEASRSLQRPVLVDAAFDRLVRTHRAPLERYVRGLGASREDAEEIAATALLRAYQSPPAAHRDSEWRAWLSTVARNVWIDARRRRELRLVSADGVLESVPSSSESVDQIAATAEEARQICASIALLPPAQRAALYLREVRGLSYGEIAAQLGITLMSVTALLQRARDSVKQRRGGLSGALSALAFSPIALLRRGSRLTRSAGAYGAVAKVAVPVVLVASAGGVALVAHHPAAAAPRSAPISALRLTAATSAAKPATIGLATIRAPFASRPVLPVTVLSARLEAARVPQAAALLSGPAAAPAATTTNASVDGSRPATAGSGPETAHPAVHTRKAPPRVARGAAHRQTRGNSLAARSGAVGKHPATLPAKAAAAASSKPLAAGRAKAVSAPRHAAVAPTAGAASTGPGSHPATPSSAAPPGATGTNGAAHSQSPTGVGAPAANAAPQGATGGSPDTTATPAPATTAEPPPAPERPGPGQGRARLRSLKRASGRPCEVAPVAADPTVGAPVLIGVARVPDRGMPRVAGLGLSAHELEGLVQEREHRSDRPLTLAGVEAVRREEHPAALPEAIDGPCEIEIDERGRTVVPDDDVLEADVVVTDERPQIVARRSLATPDGIGSRPEIGDGVVQAALEARDADEQLIACRPGEGRHGDVAGDELERLDAVLQAEHARRTRERLALEVPQEVVDRRRPGPDGPPNSVPAAYDPTLVGETAGQGLLRLPVHRSSGSAGTEAHGTALAGTLDLPRAIPRRGRRDELPQESRRGFGHGLHGALEGLLIGPCRAVHAADLAHVLQCGGLHLFLGRGRVVVVQRADVSAHAGSIRTPGCPAAGLHTGDEPAGRCALALGQLGIVDRAALEGDRAARMEAAAARDRGCVRRLTLEQRPRAHAPVHGGHDGQQGLGVGMLRVGQHLLRGADLDDAAEIHHGHSIARDSSVLALIWMIYTSFKSDKDLFGHGPWALPSAWHFENYANAWRQAFHIASYFFNSFYLSALTTFVAVIITAMAAYVISRMEFRGSKLVLYYLIAALMVPGFLYVVPLYLLMVQRVTALEQPHSAWGMLYITGAIPFNTFVPERFLQDAAIRARGSGSDRRCLGQSDLLGIMLPLAQSGLVTVAIFTFIGNWNEFFWSLVLLRDKDLFTLSRGLYNLYLDGQYTAQWTMLFARHPDRYRADLIIFVVLQDRITEGLTVGALKG